jgi:hypothetical protein
MTRNHSSVYFLIGMTRTMKQVDRVVRPLVLLGILLLFLGCENYGGRQAVSGQITLEAQPLKQGIIMFTPLDGQGTPSGAPITDGNYSVPRQNGLKPGKYLVKITAGDGKTPNTEEEIAGPGSTNIVSVDLVPEDWNTKSKQEIEVKSSGPNKFDFAIPKAVDPTKAKRKRR